MNEAAMAATFMELAAQGPARGGSFIVVERGALSVKCSGVSVSKQTEMIIPSEVSQKEKDKYHMISLVKAKVAQLCLTLCDPIDYTGQNTGVGSLSLLQGIFPKQGSNPSLSHLRQILYQLSHK